jgi:hypothetical protein
MLYVLLLLSRACELLLLTDSNPVTYLQEGVMLGAGLTIQQLISVLRGPASSKQCSSRSGNCSGGDRCDGTVVRCTAHGTASTAAGDVAAGGAAAAGGGGALANTSGVWSAMADHLERIAGRLL